MITFFLGAVVGAVAVIAIPLIWFVFFGEEEIKSPPTHRPLRSIRASQPQMQE